jgi:DNA-binding PadR family transcriptional regulator
MNIEKYSPLTEASFYILLSLHSPKHGYGIIKEVEDITNGRVILAPGTLYGVITTFLKNKLIVLDSVEGSKNKKTYKMSDLGKELLAYEVKRLEELVTNAREVL